MLLAACTSTRLEEAFPEAAEVPQPPVAEQVAEEESGPLDTGSFPDLNEAQSGAAPQLTEEERDARLAEIEAARAGQAARSSAGTGTSAAALRNIARTHDEETLKEIEGE